MSGNIKKLLIGASVIASVSAIATNAASAAVFRPTDIEFDTTNINTWLFTDPANPQMDSTGIGGVNRRVLNDFNNYENINKAIAALTDDDSATNVEIWTRGEAPTANVGFSANLGQNQIRVESVTANDWATGSLAEKWLDSFLGSFNGILQSLGLTPTVEQKSLIVDTLKAKGMYSAGDPNIGDITYDDQTGQLKVDLVGHLDRAMLYVDTNQYVLDMRSKVTINGQQVANPNLGKPMLDKNGNPTPNPKYLQPLNDARYNTGNLLLNQALYQVAKTSFVNGQFFQMSEIAKVTFNGVVDYAFSFSAIDAMAIAGDRSKTDRTSHTGIYSWTKTVAEPASVPEPSAMLALMVLGGFLAAKRNHLKKA
jgi:hypothetical protein